MAVNVSISIVLFSLAFLSYWSAGTDSQARFLFRHNHAWPLIAAGVIVLFEPFFRTVGRQFTNRIPRPARSAQSVITWLPVGLFFAGAMILFLLPAQRLEPAPQGLGDSLWLVEIVPLASDIIGYFSSFDEILEPLIRSLFYKSGSLLFGESLLAAGRIDLILFWLGLYSTLIGLCQLGVIVWFLKAQSIRNQLVGFLILFCVPATQLFANYIEHYSFAAFALTSVLLLIWWDFENKAVFIWPLYSIAVLSALAVLHHLIAVFFLPGLIAYIWQRHRIVRCSLRMIIGPTSLALLILAIGNFIYFQMLQLSTGGSHVVHPPVLPLHKFFSSANLAKILFVLLFTTPLFLAIAASKGFFRQFDSFERIVIVFAVTFFIQMAVWNPVIGLPADWDLLSFVSWPLHVLIFRKYTKNDTRFTHRSGLNSIHRPGLIAVGSLTLLPMMMWMLYNHKAQQDDTTAIAISRQSLWYIKQNETCALIPTDAKKQLLYLQLLSDRANLSQKQYAMVQMKLGQDCQKITEGDTATAEPFETTRTFLQSVTMPSH